VEPLQKAMAVTLLVNYGICLAFWFGWNDAAKYPKECGGGSFGNGTALGNMTTTTPPCHDGDASEDNLLGLGFYLFPPFWMPYFVAGIIAAYLFDALRPNEQHDRKWWGVVGDGCTVLIFALMIAQITKGQSMRPDEADTTTKAAIAARLWSNLYPRLLAPVTVLWVYCIATGEGMFAKLCRWPFLVDVLSPHSYNCFLFQQIVGQWYYAITRGKWWNWWNYRKTQYHFSPYACPVEWYEIFYLIGLTVCFSHMMTMIEVPLTEAFNAVKNKALGISNNVADRPVIDVVCSVVEDMTGLEVEPDWLLEECGLASIGVPVLAGLLAKKYNNISVPITDLIEAETIAEVALIIEAAKDLAEQHGV